MPEVPLRYARHIALKQIGEAGQEQLAGARVLIIGLGGLGSPAALYLAASGVGTLLLNDFDSVDLSNLQRQILYVTRADGIPKTVAAIEHLLQLNPEPNYVPIDRRLNDDELHKAIADCDVVLDGSDNFGTRFAVNQACVETQTPLVSGAAIRFEGQLAVFPNDRPEAPCYRCLYQESDETLDDCRGSGVLAPLVGVVGSMMAVEAIKLIVGCGEPARGRLLVYDALDARWRDIKLNRDPDCPVCG